MFDPRITDLEGWVAALIQPGALIELGVLVLCGIAAWSIAALVSRAMVLRGPSSIMFGRRIVDGVLFPLLLLCLAYAAQALLARWVAPVVFKIAIPVLLSLLVIRLGVKVKIGRAHV